MNGSDTSTVSSGPDGPAHLAKGLHGTAYTSDAFWQRERETLFQSHWVFAGFVHELPDAGDAVPVSIGGTPVLLIRNREGEISAFHNVCRHRCLELVDKPRNVGRTITCPYHAWSYDLDGALRSTPHFDGYRASRRGPFDARDHGLVPVRSAIWQDWVFVNLDGSAPDFADYAAPLIEKLQGIDFNKLSLVGVLDFGEVATNWKFLMENFIEPYHVQVVHSSTTDQPLKDHYTIIDGPCLGSAVDLPEEQGVGNSLAVSSRYLTLFPTFVLGRYFPDQLGVYQNIPIGPGRTRQRRAIYTTEGHPLTAAQAENLKSLWHAVHLEDHEMCTRMQNGRASPVAADGGFLSPVWEDSVRAFQDLVAANTEPSTTEGTTEND